MCYEILRELLRESRQFDAREFRILASQKVIEANGGVLLTLSNNQSIQADHVILATGYRVDVRRLSMLGNSILPQVQDYQGSPVLSSYFETSVPGLYFVGFSSHKSCGAYYRFVVGTGAAAQRVASAVARRARVGSK